MTRVQNELDQVHSAKCELAAEVLRSSGTLRLGVTGWSMLPTLMPRDILTIERVRGNSISCGDIVLFNRNRRIYTHRVISKLSSGHMVTRGDAMPQADTPPIAASEVLGRVSSIVRKGRCIVPARKLGVARRIAAEAIRRSDSAARVVVGLHQMRHSVKEFPVACQS